MISAALFIALVLVTLIGFKLGTSSYEEDFDVSNVILTIIVIGLIVMGVQIKLNEDNEKVDYLLKVIIDNNLTNNQIQSKFKDQILKVKLDQYKNSLIKRESK